MTTTGQNSIVRPFELFPQDLNWILVKKGQSPREAFGSNRNHLARGATPAKYRLSVGFL